MPMKKLQNLKGILDDASTMQNDGFVMRVEWKQKIERNDNASTN